MNESYIRIYCLPCMMRMTFPLDGALAVQHANRHGMVIEYTEADGAYIGAPEPQHTPSEPITYDELLDLQDMSIDAWSLAFRFVVVQASVDEAAQKGTVNAR